MSNPSIALTFSDDGEFIQLSRMDAAVLLTWIMGGDHDNGPEQPQPKREPTTPEARGLTRPKSDPAPSTPEKSPLAASSPLEDQPVFAEENSAPVPPTPEKKVREPLPSSSVQSAAAQILQGKIVPDLPFPVTPSSAELPAVPRNTPAPTPQELLEEEPYWDYDDAPKPLVAPKKPSAQ